MTAANNSATPMTLPTDLNELHRMVSAYRSLVAQYAEREQVYLRALDQLVAPSDPAGYHCIVDMNEDVTDAVGEVFAMSPAPVAVFNRAVAS